MQAHTLHLILLPGWSGSGVQVILFPFSTVGSLSYLYLFWKRPSSHVSPWQEFGNRPAHQEGVSSWERAGPPGGDMLLAPTQ